MIVTTKTRLGRKPRQRLPVGRLPKEERQRQLLDAVQQMTEAKGYPPTLRELATVMTVSLTRIAQLMAACEEQGLIRKVPGICRSYLVVR
jgi:SOS-response transcriptional repressor LexA